MKYSKEMDTVEKKLKKCRASIREKEAFYASRANMIATTVSKLVVDYMFENVKYDLVMFDEVSMAYVTQLICAAKGYIRLRRRSHIGIFRVSASGRKPVRRR